jgi:CheY-like chemotaxis protein
VQSDATFGNHAFDFAARRDSGSGEQLGDPLGAALVLLWREGRSAPSVAAARHWRAVRSFRAGCHWIEVLMLFGRRKQIVKRILIVEDEPLTAFDNESMLGDAGYEIVATVDDLEEALEVLGREPVHLVLSDVRLRKQQTGIHLARTAKEKGIPTLFVTGHPYPGAPEIAVGCLLKPYTERQLLKAIECVDRHLQGEKVKTPKGLELFIQSAEES